MKLAIIGAGYVGLVTAACFAETGNTVVCVDLDEARLARLREGELPIHEPGLDDVVRLNAAAGRLIFTSSYAQALDEADVVFIAVGTPPREDGSADLHHVLQAAGEVGRTMSRNTLVVVKSTVPVGTCDRVQEIVSAELARRGKDWRVVVASNPEFLREGSALEDFRRADRIIVGTRDDAAVALLRTLFAPFNRHHERMLVMDTRSSEFTKYASNVALAARISLMNEFARIAEPLGVDIEAVRHGVGADARIGASFLYAGIGFGGSCFPKDLRALIRMAEDHGVAPAIMRGVQQVNDTQGDWLFDKIEQWAGRDLSSMTLAVWGLAFKPGTDDIREAPALRLIRRLVEAGARVRAYDPVAMSRVAIEWSGLPGLTLHGSAQEACEGAQAVAVVTEWLEFRSPDFRALARGLGEGAAVFDGRNIYDPAWVESAGLAYYGIGRGRSATQPSELYASV